MSNDYNIRYDASKAPKPDVWLELDEQERMRLVETFHQRAHINIPRLKAHVVVHVIVENQIALNEEPTKQAMVRLRSEGLSRHHTIHAIANVLSIHLNELMASPAAEDSPETLEATAKYHMELDNLTAKGWLNQTL